MAKRLIPLLDRILVEKLTPPAKSIGGVLLPDSAGKVPPLTRARYRDQQKPIQLQAQLAFTVKHTTDQTESLIAASMAYCFACAGI